jgi:acetoin utilization protein AcuB
MKVSSWMTTSPYCARPDALLIDVATAMQRGHFRQAPVVDADGKLLGIVTQRDLREHKGYLDSTRVSAAMVEPAVAILPDDSVEDATRTILERKIGGLPVIDIERRVVGVVTTTDLLRGLLDSLNVADTVRIDVPPNAPVPGIADTTRVLDDDPGSSGCG